MLSTGPRHVRNNSAGQGHHRPRLGVDTVVDYCKMRDGPAAQPTPVFGRHRPVATWTPLGYQRRHLLLHSRSTGSGGPAGGSGVNRSNVAHVGAGRLRSGRRGRPLGCSTGEVSRPPTGGGGQRHRARRGRHRFATSTCARQTADYVQPGSDVELLFVAPTAPPTRRQAGVDHLRFGTVSLTGDGDVPRQGGLLSSASRTGKSLGSSETADEAQARSR